MFFSCCDAIADLILPELRKQTLGWIGTAQDTATDFYDTASDSFRSLQERVKEIPLPNLDKLEAPAFVTTLFNSLSEAATKASDGIAKTISASNKDGGENNNNSEGGGGKETDAAAVAALIGATLSSPADATAEEDRPLGKRDRQNELMGLTRKLIEIRSILLSIDHSDTLKLPSIVVIGSQSSGKSSVLEAIVGQEFLPKYVHHILFLLSI